MQRAATALLVLFAVAVVAGCGGGEDRAERPAEATGVTFDLPGGAISGRVYGTPTGRGIVLLDGDEQTADWTGLANELSRQGYQVLVLPYSERDGLAAARAAADQLTRQGAERVAFIGSGRSAVAALSAAAGGAAGVAVLNPASQPDPIPGAGMPPVAVLVMSSLTDSAGSITAQRVYDAAREPRTLALYPARDAAPAALAGESNELSAAFFDFLRSAFQPLSA
jgi:hypothetical protein